jgi:hypothetical protein
MHGWRGYSAGNVLLASSFPGPALACTLALEPAYRRGVLGEGFESLGKLVGLGGLRVQRLRCVSRLSVWGRQVLGTCPPVSVLLVYDSSPE